MNPRAIDLFSGFGGVAISMVQTGFRVISIDVDPVCGAVASWNLSGPQRIFANAPDIICRTEDLFKTEPAGFVRSEGVSSDEIAWIHASPECRDHSPAGMRPLTGMGHDALLIVARWAAVCPNAHITIENVPRVVVSHRYFQLISALSVDREVRAYNVRAEWYGVPQKRRRHWVCAGPVGGRCISSPPPSSNILSPRSWEWAMKHPCPIETVDDGWRDRPTPWQLDLLPWVPEGKTSAEIAEPNARRWMEESYPDPAQRKFIIRLHRERPVPTVVTGVRVDGKLLHCHPWLNRPSTVRECARFQGFPDEFKFPRAILKLVDAYRGIGNAVPPPMAEAIARQIMNSIQQKGSAQK